MKFLFNPTEDAPEEITIYGIRFKKGEVVDVPADLIVKYPKGKEVSVISKLRGISTFCEKRATRQVNAGFLE